MPGSFAMLATRGLSPSLCLFSLLLALHGAERSQPPPQRRFEYKLSFKGPRLAVPGAGIPFWSHHGGEGPSKCYRAYSQRDSGCERLYLREVTWGLPECRTQDPSQTCLLLPHALPLCLLLCLSTHTFFVHGIYLWRTQRHWQNKLLGM